MDRLCTGMILMSCLAALLGNIIIHSDAKVLMEYIGATGIEVKFDDVPISDGIDFYFLLSFAIDANSDGEYQNGVFSPYWADTLTPDAAKSVKERHPNVKAMASLSGWSIHTNEGRDKVLFWYNPTDPEIWIHNAVNSLSTVVKNYHLDGIDIDYENFPRRNNFGYCIGELITRLKNKGIITIATIAPYHLTVTPYIDLFRNYSSVIDYVNYQFYTDKVKTPTAYLQDFQLRGNQFDCSKLLPSYEVDGRGIQGNAFFTALSLIQQSELEINGIMIFSADVSESNGDYYYERRSQAFLLNSTSTDPAVSHDG